MRLRVLAVLLRLCLPMALLMLRGGAGWAQTATSQAPSHPGHDTSVTPPAPAPRQTVRQVEPSAPSSPPVVAPHGSAHPHRPPKKARTTSLPPEKAPIPPAKAPQAGAASPPTGPDTTPDLSNTPKAVAPEQPPGQEKPEDTAARLPRFASLRSDNVNMRLGPGTRYRIDWVYKRRDLPVEIEREYDVWRWVRDPEGIHGWVHQATLMGRRSFIVQNAEATLRTDPADTASPVAILKPGVIGRIRSCEAGSEWCNVQTGSYRGYLRRQQFWGVLPGEAVAP